MAIDVSPALRAADPHFAAMCDIANQQQEAIGLFKKTIALKDDLIASLQAEIATLRAQLSAKAAA